MNTFLTIITLVFIITIVTYFKGKDGDRSIVVYEYWNDVGLSFFAIIFPMSVTIIMINSESFSQYAPKVGLVLMIYLLGKLAIHTYKSNNGNILFFIMAYITKIFLGMTLFIQIMNVISPDKDENGNSNFWSALLILLIVIPMVNNLVVNKNQGSKINPFAWIRKRTKFTRLT